MILVKYLPKLKDYIIIKGKRYNRYSVIYESWLWAKRTAKSLRNEGYNVRIFQSPNGFVLYIRERK